MKIWVKGLADKVGIEYKGKKTIKNYAKESQHINRDIKQSIVISNEDEKSRKEECLIDGIMNVILNY